MMMMTCLDLYKKSEITIYVHLQNIVVVYRDMFVPSSQEVWNYCMCAFTRHRSSISGHVCTPF